MSSRNHTTMKLKLVRHSFTDTTTIGDLYINGKIFCQILEDKDRGLYADKPETIANKIKGQTAIPYGTYKVINSFSPRFQKYLPLLLNVPGYAGIRIHPGNTHVDTEGCLLPGIRSGDTVVKSKYTFGLLHAILKKAEKSEEITIEITKLQQ